MVQKIEAGYEDINVNRDIESFRFTAEDLLKSLSEQRAKIVGNSTMAVGPAQLTAAVNEEMLYLLHSARKARIDRIKHAFKADQLKEYLRANGKKTTGTKDAMVGRIIDEVWGLSSRVLESKFNEPKPDQNQDGMTLTLGEESMEHIGALKNDYLKQLEKEFKVNIVLNEKEKSLRVTGVMHNVRAALSVLREKLIAKTTVEVNLAQYGTPRSLSAQHMELIAKKINTFSDGNVSYFDGELFVSSDSRISSLQSQQALVEALLEHENTSTFIVVPDGLSGSLSCTLVPAADPISQPHTAIPNLSFYTHALAEASASIDILAKHSLFERHIVPEISPSYSDLTLALREWVSLQPSDSSQSVVLSAKLGKVMVDVDSAKDPLEYSFYKPDALLNKISEASPLFGFSSNVSPLAWLEGTKASDITSKELVLKFAKIQQNYPEEARSEGGGEDRRIPRYGSDALVVRVGVDKGRLLFDRVKISHLEGERKANVAILQAAQDFQLSVSTRQAVECTPELKSAVVGVVHKLGLAGSNSKGQRPHRYETVSTPLGTFGLQSAELVDTTHKEFNTGFSVNVHQTWNMVDDLRYSQVELLPVLDPSEARQMSEFLGSQDRWEQYLLYLFQSAMASAPKSTH
ncbi:hypothetical protein GGI12_001325 [Dipsacomyces acuminosporus]|nr:hypothetical protein GGI12_001325 [Dipsacomyces acuminosporus]